MSEAAPAGRRTVRGWPIRVRRARPNDKAAVLSFATRTWDDWDYIPQVWDRWLAATDGVLLVASTGGTDARDADGGPLQADQAIAVARLAMLSGDEGWLEGIRVDPRVRGMNVATDFQVAELRWAAAHGVRVVRYATGQDNAGSHRLGARHGFSLLGEWRWYGVDDEDESIPPPSDDTSTSGSPATLAETDAESWWPRVAADESLRRGHGLYERRAWALQELTEERFRGHVSRGQVSVWPDADAGTTGGGEVAVSWALAIDRDEGWGDEDPSLPASPALLIGDGLAALELIRSMSGGRPGVPRVRLPDVDPPILDIAAVTAWAAAGWKPRDRTLHILTRPLDAAHPVPEPDEAALLEMAEEPRPIARPWSPAAPLPPR